LYGCIVGRIPARGKHWRGEVKAGVETTNGKSLVDDDKEKELPGEGALVCSLSNAKFRRRAATLLARFKTGRVAVEEVERGYAFRFPGDGKWLVLAGAVMASERRCCPFLTFELLAEANLGAVTVRITGPEGTKEFLRETLGLGSVR
jgi:hypothetical protein